MTKNEAIEKYGAEIVELARDMHETDFGKVLFPEDVQTEWDIPQDEEEILG